MAAKSRSRHEYTLGQVATELGVSVHVVYYWIKHHHIEARRAPRKLARQLRCNNRGRVPSPNRNLIPDQDQGEQQVQSVTVDQQGGSMKPLSQCRPRGWTRCTRAPSPRSRSAAQYQQASKATSGSGPASAIAIASCSGSLSIFDTARISPAPVIRTITDRRRCKSNTDILLLTFHQGLLPSLSVRCGNPECASHPRMPSRGGVLADHNRLSHEEPLYKARRPRWPQQAWVTQKRRSASS